MGTLRERELAAVAGLLERRGARFRDVKHVSFKLMHDRLLLRE